MSILTSASGSSVSRGYDYYNRSKVSKIMQLNDHEYEGYVDGSSKRPYYVKIDINHPRKSYCDCPHANSNIICKHMVALYFSLFQDEAEEYEEWQKNDYNEDDDVEYDNYEDSYYHEEKFEKPIFFDMMLENYVDNLEEFKLRETLKEELRNNEKRAFDLYLKGDYKKYLQNNEGFNFLDKINKKAKDLTGFYNYNYNDFKREILTIQEKRMIKKTYHEKSLQKQIDSILFVPELAVYYDYQWLAQFYKKTKSDVEIKEFCNRLEDYLDSLKHYSIKNSVPKSNVLIVIYLLSNYSIKEIASSLLKNVKYLEYIDYVVESIEDYSQLYDEVMKGIKNNYFVVKRYLPDLLYRFVHASNFEDKNIYYNFGLYSFLCDGSIAYLSILEHSATKSKIIKDIEIRCKDVFILIKLYKHFNETSKLWDLLNNDKNKYLFIDNVEELKEKYHNELYSYFIEQFYKTLKIDKKREVYQKASMYVKAISKLYNGENLINELISNIKKSEYQKCYALFDEIEQAIKN